MRLPLIPIPSKVRSLVPGWKGWRINMYGVVVKESCECDIERGCLSDVYEDEEVESCECSRRPPHTHTWAGFLGSRPIFLPRVGKGRRRGSKD